MARCWMCDYGVSVMKREAWEAAIMDAQPRLSRQRICQLPKIFYAYLPTMHAPMDKL